MPTPYMYTDKSDSESGIDVITKRALKKQCKILVVTDDRGNGEFTLENDDARELYEALHNIYKET